MWLLLAPAWAGGIDAVHSFAGTEPDAPPDIVQPAGDLDGDGTGDLVIGVPLDDRAGDTAGAIWIVYGPEVLLLDGLTPLRDLGAHLWGEETQDNAGADVAALGDSDGDGLDDVVVGAPNATIGQTQAGKIYALYGGSTRYADQPLGDEPTIRGVENSDRVGARVYAGGDLDGDGRTDLLFGVPYANPSGDPAPGWLGVLYGRSSRWPDDTRLDTDVSSTTSGTTADIAFWINYTTSLGGRAAAVVPDVNGDGNPEILVGAPGVDTETDLTGLDENIGTLEPPGAVYVYSTPNRESCDGVDNDLDGLVDEGLDADGDGLPDCEDTEVCDTRDNDGDGEVDEGFDLDGDGRADCDAFESCNGIDDDGDGDVDEDFDVDGDGIPDCSAEEAEDDCPNELPPCALVPDPCDGLDNDGDGEIDEGLDCPSPEDRTSQVLREDDTIGLIAGNYQTANLPWVMAALDDGRVALGVPLANNQGGAVLLYDTLIGTLTETDAAVRWDGDGTGDQSGWGLAAAHGLAGALVAIGEPGWSGGRGRVRLVDEDRTIVALEGCRSGDLAGTQVRAHAGPDPSGEDAAWIGMSAPGLGWYEEGYGYGYVLTADQLGNLGDAPCREGDEIPDPDADGDGWAASEDCNDAAAWVWPGAPEVCGNDADDDCDDAIDEACGESAVSCGCAGAAGAASWAAVALGLGLLARRRR